jgi:hypothetical protein
MREAFGPYTDDYLYPPPNRKPDSMGSILFAIALGLAGAAVLFFSL